MRYDSAARRQGAIVTPETPLSASARATKPERFALLDEVAEVAMRREPALGHARSLADDHEIALHHAQAAMLPCRRVERLAHSGRDLEPVVEEMPDRVRRVREARSSACFMWRVR